MHVSLDRCSEDPVTHPGSGDHEQTRDQLPLVYAELRRVARMFLARERSDHTLQPTALVHEAYLRLIGQRQVDWTNRAQVDDLRAVRPIHLPLVDQPEIRLVDERRGLQRVVRALTEQKGARQAPQLVIDELQHLVAGLLAAPAAGGVTGSAEQQVDETLINLAGVASPPIVTRQLR